MSRDELFEHEPGFPGLPEEGFRLFALPSRQERRRAIIEVIHPRLEALGEDLVHRLSDRAAAPLHAHLPRLDWPRDYQPFCTWLALSRDSHGYQSGPQLNVGVHADHVAARLGWDTASDAFGRFEFLCRHGELGDDLVRLAAAEGLRFRVYPAGCWPEGARPVFESAADLRGSLDELHHRGVWWELGRRYELPAEKRLACSPEFGEVCAQVFETLLPYYDRVLGDPEHPPPPHPL
jgi:hypothetical protein